MKKTIIAGLMLATEVIYAAFPLARDGRACAEIVTGNTSDVTIQFAASELRHWVKEISGAELPLRKTPGNAEYKLFLVCRPKGFPADIEKLKGNDGYAVRMKGKSLYIIASCPKGILNAVFRLLFKNTDIIWARPNPKFGTIFTKSPNLTFKSVNYIDIPVYKQRAWMFTRIKWGVQPVDTELWGVRQCSNFNRISTPRITPLSEKFGTLRIDGFGHNLVGRYILPHKYYDKHPDFYPLKNGKRIKPGKYPFPQLCFTNPKLVKTMAFEVNRYVDANPGMYSYSICMEDTEILCECPDCIKPIKLNDGSKLKPGAKAFRSTQFFLWLNAVTKLVRKKHPEARFRTQAYLFNEIAPKCKINDCIDISFCPIYQNLKYPLSARENVKSRGELLNWFKLTKNIILRGYYGLTPACPRPTDAVAIDDWRFCNRHGVSMGLSSILADFKKGFISGKKIWDANAMYFWVMLNANWNPYQDLNDLRMEFLTRVFGAGAPDVKDYYAILEKQWNNAQNIIANFQDSPEVNWTHCLPNDGIIDSCRAALERAKAKVTSVNGKKMLKKVRANFEYGVKAVKSSKIVAKRTAARPDFLPSFDNAEWTTTPVMEQFYEQYHSSRTGKLHANKTALRLLYDDVNLYIGIRCFHNDPKNMYCRPPSDPKKNYFPDGEGFQVYLGGNFIGNPKYAAITFDPNKNMRISGQKIKYDLKTSFNPDGWSAMLTIPWHDLGIKPRRERKFRALFIRMYDRINKRSGRSAFLISGKRNDPRTFIKVVLEE